MDKWDKIWKRREKIYVPSSSYTVIRIYARRVFYSFYKKVYVINFHNVSLHDPVIFAPNHQNTLMDALAIVHTCGPLQPVFLARQDVFNTYFFARILTLLKMMPVYRDRDGGTEAVKKNEKIFEIVNETLKNKKQIGIMPEASHGNKRRLKSTVKGTYRIAFRAQEDFGDQPAVKLIPVGLEYTDYVKYQAELLVNYGPPIEVSDYMPIYKENPAKGLLALKNRYEEEVKKLMIHIAHDEYYETYENLRTLYGRRMLRKMGIPSATLPDRVIADQQMIKILDTLNAEDPSSLQKLDGQVTSYLKLLKEHHFRNRIIEKGKFPFLLLLIQSILSILFLPFFLYGYINNFLPYQIPVWATKKIKDLQFHSSIKYVAALLTFPVFYLLQFLIVVLFTRGIWWIEWTYLISLPCVGWFAKVYYFQVKKLISKGRFTILKLIKNKDIGILIQWHREIINSMEKITTKYL